LSTSRGKVSTCTVELCALVITLWLSDESNALLGSLEAVTGKGHADRFLPDWLEEGTESSLRDSEDDKPQVSAVIPTALGSGPRSIASPNLATPVVLTPTAAGTPVTSSKGAWTDLDKFYADADEQSEDESESEDEDDEDDEGEDATEDEDEEEASAEENDDESNTHELDH
jgi:AP-3 complex subunit beta